MGVNEYSELSAEIEDNIRAGMSREEAVETAIDTCIQRGILTDILLKEKAEVTHMLLTEYDEKRHLRNTFLEGREEGREEGLKEGLRKGLEKGRDEKLIELVQKKQARGKSISEIAEELVEEITVIEQIIKG